MPFPAPFRSSITDYLESNYHIIDKVTSAIVLLKGKFLEIANNVRLDFNQNRLDHNKEEQYNASCDLNSQCQKVLEDVMVGKYVYEISFSYCK